MCGVKTLFLALFLLLVGCKKHDPSMEHSFNAIINGIPVSSNDIDVIGNVRDGNITINFSNRNITTTKITFGRITTPNEVVSLYSFFVNPDSSFVILTELLDIDVIGQNYKVVSPFNIINSFELEDKGIFNFNKLLFIKDPLFPDNLSFVDTLVIESGELELIY